MERFCMAPSHPRIQVCNPKRMSTQMESTTKNSIVVPALLRCLSDHLEIYLTHYSTWVPGPQKRERRKLIEVARELAAGNEHKPEAIEEYASSIPLYTTHRRPSPYALVAAIEKAGSQAALGKQLGVTQQALCKWQASGVPMQHWETLLNYLIPEQAIESQGIHGRLQRNA